MQYYRNPGSNLIRSVPKSNTFQDVSFASHTYHDFKQFQPFTRNEASTTFSSIACISKILNHCQIPLYMLISIAKDTNLLADRSSLRGRRRLSVLGVRRKVTSYQNVHSRRRRNLAEIPNRKLIWLVKVVCVLSA